MFVVCRTNLDLANEQWPTQLPAVPQVGDRIQSQTKHGIFQLELTVVGVTWKRTPDWVGEDRKQEWYPEIELHERNRTLTEFYEWYAPLVGSRVSAFI